MGNIKRKTVPLSLFYLKYLLFILAGIIAVVTGSIILFMLMVNNGIIYSANYAEKEAKKAEKDIGNTEKFSKELIPDVCQYVLFDKNGNVKEGDIKDSLLKDAWAEVNAGKKPGSLTMGSQYYYIVAECSEGHCVIAYNFTPQYSLPLLRKYLPEPQNLIIISAFGFILLIVIIISVCFGRALNRKLTPLIAAAEKIQGEELGFNVSSSDIKEINVVLNAIDNMRIALKDSLESKWKAEQDRKEQIMALAHDLKTPLTLVRGNAELLHDTGLTEEQEELAGYIESSSRQMQDYIQRLIGITRYGYELQLKKTSIVSFLNEVTEQAERLFTVRNINLKKSYKYKTGCFMADKELLIRAFINIFSNAAEYTPERNEVFFEVKLEDIYIVFKITDTGNGFSKEALV